MNQIIKVVFTIIATLIGAGFASGQEICAFFYVYGNQGLLGLFVCNLLFTCIVYKVFRITQTCDIDNYKDLVYFIVGRNGFLIYIVVNLFILITFFIMLAGFGAYFSQEVGISTYIGSGVLSILCFITFKANTNGIVKVSSLLVPILIFFIVIIGIINIKTLNISTELYLLPQANNFSWIISSILYASYNSILLIPVLVTLKKQISTKKDNLIVAFISGSILLILSLCIFFMLPRVNIDITKLEMPVIYVISHFYIKFKKIYAFIILSSIYTTAISIGMSFLNNLLLPSTSKISYTIVALIMCITGFAISGFGFANLVSLLYPFFGYLGLFQIALLLFKKSAKGDVVKWHEICQKGQGLPCIKNKS